MKRSSFHALGVIFLSLFLLLSLFFEFGFIFEPIMGSAWGIYSKFILLFFIITISMAVVSFEVSGKSAPPIWKKYVFVFIAALLVMFLIGVIRSNPYRVIILDLVPYVVVLSGFILGRRDEVLEGILSPVLFISYVALFVGFLFMDPDVIYDHSRLTLSFGYQMSSQLSLLPLIALIAVVREKKFYYVASIIGLLASTLLYLYFAKRVPFARSLIYFVLVVIAGLIKQSWRNNSIYISALSMAIILYMFSVFMPLQDMVKQLESRYGGDTGVIESVTSENPRFDEAMILLQEISWTDWFFGRGLGGYLTSPDLMYIVQDVIDEDTIGRLHVHVGNLVPLLKGGVFFTLIYFFPLILMLISWRKILPRMDLSSCCLVWGFVYLAFQFIEGPPTYSNLGEALALGMSGGRIQYIMKNNNT
jgi:hypothetical protein